MAVLVVFGLVLAVEPGYAAKAERAYAGIVVDAKTGKTLYESAADAPRYPASVTKVMTLYILFEELKAGHLKLSSRMTVSKHAAAAVPTKLGIKAGSTISVEDAIKAIVTLSANDMARVVAETIGGSESKFAARMTKTARALGMSRTTYVNASGLPDKRQLTTARDQARLGVAIYEHFTTYYKYFQTRVFKYGGRSYGNHNQLLGAVPGVDGIKTGYIRDSGYNLLTAARLDNRHIVVVGFGFDTGASRNAKVVALINKYMPKARSGSYLATALVPEPSIGGSGPIRVASSEPSEPALPAPVPDFRRIIEDGQPIAVATIDSNSAPEPAALLDLGAPLPQPLSPPTGIDAANQVASASEAPQPAGQRPFDVIGAWLSTTLRLDGSVGASGGPVPPLAIGAAAPVPAPAAAKGTIDLLTSGSIANAAEETDGGEVGWIVQIGAAPSENGAYSLLEDATEIDRVGDMRRYVERFERNGQVFYRARIAGFADAAQARLTCEELKKINMSCLAIQG